MSTRRRPWGAAAAAFVPAALVIALVAPVSASAVPDARTPDYPSWHDVQEARKNQAATEREIDKIEGILVALENQANDLGKQAQLKAEEYSQARDALATATAKVDRLQDLTDKAEDRAKRSAARAAQIIAQLARTGGGDITLGLLIGSASDTDNLLSRLGTMNRITASSADILARAQFDQKLAQSLADDAEVAEGIRSQLADEAQNVYDQAQAAFDKANAQVEEQNSHADRLYAQLASLKGTTAEIERQYQAGVDAAVDDPTPNPNPNPPTNPTTNPTPPTTPPTNPTPPPGVDPTPDPPVAGTVQQAIAYAKAQLGEPYAFGGSGPGSWDCSGLTKASYASAGVYIGTHSVSNQYATMKAQGRLVPVGQRQAGDLLFYSSGGSSSGGFYHVAIYIGGGKMIEAPRPGASVRIVAVRGWDLVGYAGRPTG